MLPGLGVGLTASAEDAGKAIRLMTNGKYMKEGVNTDAVKAADLRTGDTFFMGFYPQSKVTDEALIAAFSAEEKENVLLFTHDNKGRYS